MTTFTKSVIALAFAGAVFGTAAFFGLTPFGQQVVQQVISSPAGSTFNTAKTAAAVMAPTAVGANATSTSILNTDTSDRYVKSAYYFCSGMGANFFAQTGAGVSALRLTLATTSAANSNLIGTNTHYILDTNVTTSTQISALTGTTTPGQTATQEYLKWPTGSYLTWQINATSSAASCVVGVDYSAS